MQGVPTKSCDAMPLPQIQKAAKRRVRLLAGEQINRGRRRVRPNQGSEGSIGVGLGNRPGGAGQEPGAAEAIRPKEAHRPVARLPLAD